MDYEQDIVRKSKVVLNKRLGFCFFGGISAKNRVILCLSQRHSVLISINSLNIC